MRVQCDVCEKALAEVVCCADEAALCLSCDQRVHAANKLASKHQRLRLLHNHSNSANPSLPLCDICQEKGAFIFCLEDRALVCRDCDVCIHAVNTLAAGHQRFLATGVQVALECEQQHVDEGTVGKPELPRPQPPSSGVRTTPILSTNSTSSHTLASMKKSTSVCADAKLETSIKNYVKQAEELHNAHSFDLTDLVSGYPIADIEFSKSDLAPLSDHDWMADLCVFDDHVYGDSMAEVPQASVSMYSATTVGLEGSGKGKQRRDVMGMVPEFDDVSVVPDLMAFASLVPCTKRQKGVVGD